MVCSPTKTPFSVNETTEGVKFSPISFGIISTLSFLTTATHEFVVPKSIPIASSS